MNKKSEDYLAYLIGVDEIKIKDRKAIIKFSLNSERYVCMKEAVSFMQEFNSCSTYEKNFLIDEIKKLYDHFIRVLERANNELQFGLEYVYDDENIKVINEMEKALVLKGKI